MDLIDGWDAALARTRAVCLSLPEAHEEEAWIGTRWCVRGKTFAHLVPVIDGGPPVYARALRGPGPTIMLTFRTAEPGPYLHAAPDDPRRYIGAGRDLVAIVLDDRTDPDDRTGEIDWADTAEALVESYRLMAPRALGAQVGHGPEAAPGSATR